MPESLLQILTFFLLLLVWLFLLRVIWAVWSDVRPPTATPARPSPPAPPPAAASSVSTAQPMGAARLKVVEPPDRKGQVFDVTDETKIGRASSCDIALADDSYVSQLHARLYRREGTLFIEDLGSTNGTFLNRKKLSGPVSLRRGDRIQIGRTVMEVSK